jgi:hypothetical protein
MRSGDQIGCDNVIVYNIIAERIHDVGLDSLGVRCDAWCMGVGKGECKKY